MARSTFTTMVLGVVCLVSAAPVGCAKGLGWNAFPATAEDEAEGGGGSGGEGGGGGSTESSTTSSSTTTSTTTTTSSSFTTTTTSSTGSPGGCDGAVACDTCANCSLSGLCASSADACFNDADCNALLDCLNTCQDDVCANACADAHPSGTNLYMGLIVCVLCDACYGSCDGATSGACQ